MTISYPLTLPSHTGRRQMTWRQRNAVQVARSPFTHQRQVQAWSAQWWECDVTLPPMKRADAETWLGWLVSLKGPVGSFLMGDPMGATARGSLGGTPLVFGASQTGGSLAIDGCTNGVTGWAKAGDWLQLGSGSTARLHKVLADANSNGSGQVTLDIWPNLRSSPADNAAVTMASCVGVFSLPEGYTPSWVENHDLTYTVNFTAIEVV
jgi:hypothetical protein